MKYLFTLITLLFSISYSSPYNILMDYRYEFGADSMVWVDSNNVPFSTHIFVRSNNKIIEISVSSTLHKDTMSMYFLNSFNKPSLIIDNSRFSKYEYDNNNKVTHVCSSGDSAINICELGEHFIEWQYQSGKVVSTTYRPAFGDTQTITYFYNDSNDVVCLKKYNTKTDSTSIDSFTYDYPNKTATHKEFHNSSIFETIYYFFLLHARGNKTQMYCGSV